MLEFDFQSRSSAEMDLVAGAGSVFSQLAVGLAGGALPEGAAGGGAGGPMANGLFKMGGRFAPKPTVDSLPDKVRSRGRSLKGGRFLSLFLLLLLLLVLVVVMMLLVLVLVLLFLLFLLLLLLLFGLFFVFTAAAVIAVVVDVVEELLLLQLYQLLEQKHYTFINFRLPFSFSIVRSC